MKILHICQNYYPSKGGPQYVMKHLSEKLVEEYGDDVTVGTTNSLYNPESKLFEKVTPGFEILNGVKVNRLTFNRWHYPFITYGNKILIKTTTLKLPENISKLRYTLDSPGIKKMMTKTDAEVIMATTINYDFCNYPLWRAKTKNAKPFILFGAIHLHQKITNLQHPSLIKARACDCYIANTDFERDELLAYGVQPNKITTVGIGIDVNEFAATENNVAAFKKQHNIAGTDVVIGFIGRLVKGKGAAILLDAFRKLHRTNKNLKLLLAGGTAEYVPDIKKAITEEKLPIILIENFDDSLKPLLYNSLDVFVLPSQSESFGIVFLEAWACKKPVIGTRMGAIASLLSDAKDSLLFEAGDVDDLAEKITLLINNKPMRQALGQNGYLKIQQRYTWPVIVKKYKDAYHVGIENFKAGQKN